MNLNEAKPKRSTVLIETPRLNLRMHRAGDLPDCVAMWSDPIVTRFIGGKPFSEQEVWSKILRYAGLWKVLGFGYWAIEEKSSGQFIGEVGFADFKRDFATQLSPSIAGLPELGWALVSSVHGKGFATEALRAATAWGDQNLEVKDSVCIISPENLASIKVAEKCGYSISQETIFAEKNHSHFQTER